MPNYFDNKVIFLNFFQGTFISIWGNFFTLIFIVLFGFVLNYYIDAICIKR